MKMFRTELDLELKVHNESGSPFFNLRDSILIIFKKHVDESEVCLELQISVKVSKKAILLRLVVKSYFLLSAHVLIVTLQLSLLLSKKRD